MSIQAVSWALKQSAVKRGEKLVLVALANYADEDGECFPSHKRLAEDTGYTRQGVAKVIRHLEEIGLLKINSRDRENGSRTSNVYTLCMGATPVARGATPVARGATGDNSIEPSSNPLSKNGNISSARGSRISEDWKPTEDDRRIGRELGFSDDAISRHSVEFVDYWLGESGQRAAKRDWSRAFRNRLRTILSYRGADDGRHGKRSGGNKPKPGSAVAAANRALHRSGREPGGAGNALADVWGSGPSNASESGVGDHGGDGQPGIGGRVEHGAGGAENGHESAGNSGRGHGPEQRDHGAGVDGVSAGRGDVSDQGGGQTIDVHAEPVGTDRVVQFADGLSGDTAPADRAGAVEDDGLDLPEFLRKTA